MSDNQYRGGPSVGGMWGCGVAALLGAPLFAVLIVGDALGDCAPDINCHKGFLSHVALPTAIAVTLIFVAVRALVGFIRRDGR
ncbi:hypothetical protein [Sphingomonas crusticola]|uniref:hypothetical protein n=1 Tax=Sphingomonas crusticola TaxID=1697973 RepID=UPI0019681BE4|nr:hypothetical protein [Sphingomonas crusticola]